MKLSLFVKSTFIFVIILPACKHDSQAPEYPSGHSEGSNWRVLGSIMSCDFEDTEVEKAIVSIFTSADLKINTHVFIGPIPKVRITFKFTGTVREVFHAISKRAGLGWSIQPEAIYIGLCGQICEVERVTSDLKRVESLVLREKLKREISICTPTSINYAEAIGVLRRTSGMQIISRFPMNEEMPQRYETFNFDRGISVESYLRFVALNWGLCVKFDGDEVVFTKSAKP